MAQIAWQALFDTGVGHIDAQHQELVLILNNLEQSIASDDTDEAVGRTLRVLSDYAARHFRNEEAFMREIQYPGYEEHVRLHRRLTARVDDLMQRKAGNRRVTAQELLALLTDWLIDHMVVEDKKYARWAQVAVSD